MSAINLKRTYDGARAKRMNKRVVVVSSIPLDEPVILNRLIPLFDQCRLRSYEPVLIGVDYSDVTTSSKLVREDLALNLYKSSKNSKHKNLVIRLIRDIYIAYKLGRKVSSLSNKADVIIVTIPSMFIPLFVFKKNDKSKLCLDVRDLTWEYLIGSSIIGTLLGRVVRNLLKLASKRFDLISVTNGEEKTYIKNSFETDNSRLVIVSNGVTEAQYSQLVTLPTDESNSSTSTNITYIGNVGIAQTFKPLIKLAECKPHLIVNIIGSGARLDNIRRYISERKIGNINVPGRLEWRSVIDYYVQSDILFLSLDEGYSSAVPSKLYEYLLIGKPIIFLGNIDSKEQFDEFRGLYFCPNNTDALHDIVEVLRQSGSMSQEDIYYNRQLVKANFIREKNWSNYLEQLLKH